VYFKIALCNKTWAFVNRISGKFLTYILVEEFDQEKLPGLLELKYHFINDAADKLGEVGKIRKLLIELQKHLYKVA
jgi:type I restriction enzyme R subunit